MYSTLRISYMTLPAVIGTIIRNLRYHSETMKQFSALFHWRIISFDVYGVKKLKYFFRLMVILFLVFSTPLRSSSQFIKSTTIPLDYTWCSCDINRNIYALQGSEFIKIVPPYSKILRFKLEKQEIPQYIDISKPEKTILFFKETGKVLILDSLLRLVIRPFYLEELGMGDISMVFASPDEGIWFYNNKSNSLTKLNKDFIPVVRSMSLNPWFLYPSAPIFALSLKSEIYLNIPSNGILVLGRNGEYISAYQLPGLIDFQLYEKAIFYYRDRTIMCFDLTTLKTRKIYLPEEPGILNAWFFQNSIILLFEDRFSVYEHDFHPLETEEP